MFSSSEIFYLICKNLFPCKHCLINDLKLGDAGLDIHTKTNHIHIYIYIYIYIYISELVQIHFESILLLQHCFVRSWELLTHQTISTE